MATVIRALKEGEAVWVGPQLVIYKKDSQYKYYIDGELTSKSTFLEFNPYDNNIVGILKSDNIVEGYEFNGVVVSPSEKNKIINGIKKHTNANIEKLEKSFKTIFADNQAGMENLKLSVETINIIGTVTALDKSYIIRIIDRSLNNEFNKDPIVSFSTDSFISGRFNKNIAKAIDQLCDFRTIHVRQSHIEDLAADLVVEFKKLYDSTHDNTRLFTYDELVTFGTYVIDEFDVYNEYLDDTSEELAETFLSHTYIQSGSFSDIIKSILKKYDETP